MKLAICDIETTGLDYHNMDIVSVAMMIMETDRKTTIDKIPRRLWFVRPLFNTFTGDPYALSMHADAFSIIAGKMDLPQGARLVDEDVLTGEIADFLDENDTHMDVESDSRFTYCGKNFGSFDLQFLRHLENYAEILEERFAHRILDVGSLFTLKTDDVMPNLNECLRRAGYQKTVDHTALGDCRDVVRCLKAYFYGESGPDHIAYKQWKDRR